ncbi:Zn-ribbon domain-containing OB-fold protein [Sulfolobus sp. E11-6]|uniref:Zn-ribbon domain-containing OB-fold protein n=1 Tax=Sulfolobus sp. E11-6 TaxID=2663020 RepID=UPI001294FD86|nr:Zn-ribbon domain-containing OB-fold protein [Sulfolobus sp. E11-6]QGA68952.1 3-hydroxybutyryl-CoA epimerase [Sulfolobus sp. E11-6]
MGISEVREKQFNEIDKKALEQIDLLIKNNGMPIMREIKTNNLLWIDVRELTQRFMIPIGRISKFFEMLSKGKIIGTKCPKCGSIYFPPQDDCTKCRISGLDIIELSGEGELLTYTIITVKPVSFMHYQDYIVGIARLKEGINILAWVNENPQDVKVGMKVKVNIVKREPEGYLTYELKKI